MKKEILKKEVKNLRIAGYSLSELSDKFNVSKSTLSLWCRDVVIPKKGLNRLSDLKKKGIEKSKEILRGKKKERYDIISKKCKTLVSGKNNYNKDDFKVFLALLYWGEGSKTGRRVEFMNSDPEMIKIYLYLFRNSFPVEEGKLRAILHLHSYHNSEEMLKYWSKITRIDKNNIIIYNKPNSGVNKKEGYKGCLSVRYGDSNIFDELKIITERFIKLFNAGLV